MRVYKNMLHPYNSIEDTAVFVKNIYICTYMCAIENSYFELFKFCSCARELMLVNKYLKRMRIEFVK